MIAAGFAIGTGLVEFVKLFVQGIVEPAVAVILGGNEFPKINTTVATGDTEVAFAWGNVIEGAIVLVLTVVFLLTAVKIISSSKKSKK